MLSPLTPLRQAVLAVALLVLVAGPAAAADQPVAAPEGAKSPPSSNPGTSTSALGRSYTQAMPLPRNSDHGSLSYTARVVHNDRQYLSYVRGTIDLTNNDFFEEITQSYILDFKVMPGKLQAAPQAMPSIWQVGGRPAQRFGSVSDANSLPSFGSALLRHFVIGQVIGAPESIRPGTCYIAQQLEIDTVQLDERGFEIVGRYRGGPLVIVGSRQDIGGRKVPKDLAILGPTGELYQYFFEDFSYSEASPEPPISLPKFNAADYVSFPAGEAQAVPIRPVKDWLVFQASLPSGRQLNLLLDSGADTMIIDDLVLELDAKLTPSGETTMEGAVASSRMKLYKGFSFNVGGVEFKNLPVVGGTITNIAYGAGMRIHGVVGSEVLQLCRLDLDLDSGQMRLLPADNSATPAGQPLPLTFINDFPHVEAEVAGKGKALMLLDTGQRTPVSVNLDALQDYKLDDSLVMDGFLGDIGGSLLPRYMLEKLNLTLGGQTFEEKTVDAAPEGTYSYNGVPVIGSIGFSLLARHYGGVTFDYQNKYLYLREPSAQREFKTSAEAWTAWQTKHYDPAKLARLVAGETLKVGQLLLSASLAPPVEAKVPAAVKTNADPVEQLLADAGFEPESQPGTKAEVAESAGGAAAADSPAETAPAATEAADPNAPAFRVRREPGETTAVPDSVPAAEATEPVVDGGTSAGDLPPDDGLGQGSRPAGSKLPPMTLKKTERRFGSGRGASELDEQLTPADLQARDGQASSGELWGASVVVQSLPTQADPDTSWLAGIRSAGGALAMALRAVWSFSRR